VDRLAGRVGSGRVQELVNFSGSGRVGSRLFRVGSGRKIWTGVQLWAESHLLVVARSLLGEIQYDGRRRLGFLR